MRTCVDSLIVLNNKIIFKSKESALLFAKNYMRLQNEHWGENENNLRYYLLSEALKIGLKENVISLEDFYEDDYYVIDKLKNTNNPYVHNLLEKLKGRINFNVVDKNPELKFKKKFRYVDPEFLEDNKIYRLSNIDHSFKEFLEYSRKLNNQGISLSKV